MYEDGNTQKELNKLFTKTPQKIQNTQIVIPLKQMAIDSDIEAAKTPEQLHYYSLGSETSIWFCYI